MREHSDGPRASEHLRSFIERIERLNEEIKALNDDKRDIYGEAKGRGFDVKAMKEVIRLRRMDSDDREEREALVETYMRALGHGLTGTGNATRASADEATNA